MLLDLLGAAQQRFEIAVFGDELGGGLDADAGHAGHVVDAVAAQRLHLDDLVGADAEFLLDLGRADPLVLEAVEQADVIVLDQLHQILVGRHDGHLAAFGAGQRCVGGDQIVGLVALLLDGGNGKGTGGQPRQRKLRHQVLGGRRALGLVFGVEVVAEGLAGIIEDHRHMGRLVVALHVLGEFVEHRAKARDGADRQPV